MKLSSLLDKRLVFLDYHFESYVQIIDFVTQQMSKVTMLSSSVIKDSLMKRENLGTTFLGHQLALPHGYVDNINEIVVLFIRLDKELTVTYDFQQNTIKYVFSIITSKKKAPLYLKVLSSIAQLVTTETHLLSNAKSPSNFLELLDQKQLMVEETMKAHDLISSRVWVSEKDTISHAVDLMKKHNLTFLPVTDNLNKLIGIIDLADLFSAIYPSESLSKESFSLLKSMDSADKLLFEPIKNFWENEERHFVGNVMRSFNTYTIDESASYVEIVFLMTKYHHRYLIVTDQSDIVQGIIDTGDVIHKMIRV
jgi:PTS system nitrogen regulatory IIA component